MYIIIVGGGQVGYSLCKALLDEGHEVLIIEKDASKCERINDEMGAVCMRGDGCETSTLSDAGAARADMFISATNEDEDNLVSCQVAKHKFGVPRTIARINNPKNEIIFKKLGVNYTVSSVNLIMEHIQEEMPTHPLVHLITIEPEGMEVVEIRIPQHAAAIGKKLKDLPIDPASLLCALIRTGSSPVQPDPDTVVKAGDKFIAVVSPSIEGQLRSTLVGA
ncbi:MAG: TrkA family potassium uptake protein [Chloroflexi bacterium]|nr:TrkA family potassium uptake protein [Chloroflexota bacterium]